GDEGSLVVEVFDGSSPVAGVLSQVFLLQALLQVLSRVLSRVHAHAPWGGGGIIAELAGHNCCLCPGVAGLNMPLRFSLPSPPGLPMTMDSDLSSAASVLPPDTPPVAIDASIVLASLPGFIYQLRLDPEGRFRYTYVGKGCEELFGVTAAAVLA